MTTVAIIDEQRTRELRRRILRPELPPDVPLPGDDVPTGVHFGAVDDDGTVVCTCFIYPDSCPWLPAAPAWHLRQMATRPDRRGEGHGAAVVEAAATHALAQGAEILWCNAREGAVGFYARLGFVGHGEIFTDERHQIPHLQMARPLTEPGGEPNPAATSSTG
jgi:predicted GNAT family N-acyltransferase